MSKEETSAIPEIQGEAQVVVHRASLGGGGLVV